MSVTLGDRFWSKVEPTGCCWLWTSSSTRGYGTYWTGETTGYAHRLAYEELVGPIPVGLQLDHICRVPLCVNPDHLEPVTQQVNLRRGRKARATHCPRSHPYDKANTRINRRGHRFCRACARERARVDRT